MFLRTFTITNAIDNSPDTIKLPLFPTNFPFIINTRNLFDIVRNTK